MSDPLIDVMHTHDLSKFSMVDTSSVSFAIMLPKRVNGDLNPTVGLTATADSSLRLAWV